MEMVGAVIALGILGGIAILVVIPILATLYYLKCRQAHRLQDRIESQQTQSLQSKKTITAAQINSLPCRLKKKTSSAGGSRSAAGESGVYDMAESPSHLSDLITSRQPVTASYTSADGEHQKLYLFGDLSSDDSLVVKEVISQHLEFTQSSSSRYMQISTTSSDSSESVLNTRKSSLSLEDIIISGLDSEGSLTFDNEGYRKDEYDGQMNGTQKRRHQVKKTLSVLSNKMRLNIRRDEKPISKFIDMGSIPNCSSYTTCKSAVIGQSGGDITLGGGIKLSIPPNALSEKLEIVLGVTFDSKHLPQLSEEDALLTPLVFCEPSGLEFKQPAVLTIPHCATKVQENWRINILRSQTNVQSPKTDWKALLIGDYESRIFYNHEVELWINHFTMYCVTGKSKDRRTASKRKKLIALSSEQHATKFSVYCVNSYKQKGQQHQQASAESSTSVLDVECQGQSIKLLVEGLTHDWTYSMDSEQQFLFQDVWHDKHMPVSLSLSSKASLEVSCDLCGWQIGNLSHKYKVALTSSVTRPPLQNGNGSRIAGRKHRNVFSESLRWDLMLLLDPIHVEGNDWRKLATQLGLGAEIIKSLEQSTSPTKELLKVWEEHSHGCIKSFLAVIVKIDRLDVADKIEKDVGKLYLETLPNHRCDENC